LDEDIYQTSMESALKADLF